jgi:lysine-ketoglutarate reductase/saccharopine dehydrogenase-like protein (TIGR00300 family)
LTTTNSKKNTLEKTIEAEGHLIDSMILTKIFDEIMDQQGDFEVLEFRIGKRKEDHSYVKLIVKGRDEDHLDSLLKDLYRLGAMPLEDLNVKLVEAPSDKILPDDFYSTTSHLTSIRLNGEWIEVEDIMMDKAIIVDPDENFAKCKPMRQVKKGELVVVGDAGIRVRLPSRPREGTGIFNFMTSQSSTEKPSISIVKRIAEEIINAKSKGEKIAVVAGPAVVHTKAAPSLANMIQLGYVDVLLSGNALAVHDVEYAILGTSLGVNLENGSSTLRGNRNHIAAINEVNKAGSLRDMVKKGILKSGIIYECITNDVPFALAGSIRDDGPLPEVITDTVKAQEEYRTLLKDADLVIMMASMLHSIAVGNLLPSAVKTICIDINPMALTKLMDRGTAQALGIISDIGALLPLLVQEIESLQ